MCAARIVGPQIALSPAVAAFASDAVRDCEGVVFRASLIRGGIVRVAIEAEIVLVRFLLATEVFGDPDRVGIQQDLVGALAVSILFGPDQVLVLANVAIVARGGGAVASAAIATRDAFMFVGAVLGNDRRLGKTLGGVERESCEEEKDEGQGGAGRRWLLAFPSLRRSLHFDLAPPSHDSERAIPPARACARHVNPSLRIVPEGRMRNRRPNRQDQRTDRQSQVSRDALRGRLRQSPPNREKEVFGSMPRLHASSVTKRLRPTLSAAPAAAVSLVLAILLLGFSALSVNAEGETLTSPVVIRFGLGGMGVAPAGVEKHGTGHHHLVVDADLPVSNLPIPKSDHYRHFGKGQTEVSLDLAPGTHTLQLVLGDHIHMPHDPPVVSERITVTVTETVKK
jgi:hypothetical protein